MHRILASLVIFLTIINVSFAQVNGKPEIFGEQIMIIDNTAKAYTTFITIRTPFNNTAWSLDKTVKLDEFLDNFLYINPIDYTWDDKSSTLYNYFTFSRGSYGTIAKGNFEEGVSVRNNETFTIEDGIYTYKNEDGVKEFNGSYGFNYEKYGFSQLTYAWILPDNLEFVAYGADKPGRWNLRKNTLIYVGNEVNNVVFTLKYKKRQSETQATLLDTIRQSYNDEGIQIEQTDTGFKLVFSDQLFFAPGKATLSKKGERELDKIAELMKKNPQFNLQIHGHTDNVPVNNIKDKIKDNWELSVFRSLNILNYIHKQKSIAGDRFEVRGYGEHKPVAPNDTAEGRAKNRRIELFLTE